MSEIEFTVTDAPPKTTRRPGRRREANQWRQALETSYEKDFKATDEWYEFNVDLTNTEDPTREVNRNVDRIRAAGQMQPKIGTEIRRDYETGRVAFRGVEWMPRAKNDDQSYAEDAE